MIAPDISRGARRQLPGALHRPPTFRRFYFDQHGRPGPDRLVDILDAEKGIAAGKANNARVAHLTACLNVERRGRGDYFRLSARLNLPHKLSILHQADNFGTLDRIRCRDHSQRLPRDRPELCSWSSNSA